MFSGNKDNKDQPGSSSMAAVESNKSSAGSFAGNAGKSGDISTIGASIRVKGDVSGDENLRIEGAVEGTVNLPAHELVIGPSGKVVADLTAKVIRVNGDVQGDVTGKENVIISSTSNVRGNVVTPRMTLEDGARFKGSIDIDPNVHNSKSGAADHSGSKLADLSGRDGKPGGI